MLPARRAAVLLVLLTLGIWFVCGRNLDAGLPHRPEPDAVIVLQALELEHGAPRGGPGHISDLYPHLLAIVLDALPGSLEPLAPLGASEAEHLRTASEPYLAGRRLVLALSMLALPGTWLVARRFLSSGWSLFAVALYATCLLASAYMRQARPHAPLASFCVLALASFLWMSRSKSPWSFLASGVTAALAVGTLHNGAALLPALLLACVAHVVTVERPRWWLLPLPFALVALSVWIFYPFLLDGTVLGKGHMPVRLGDGFLRLVRGSFGSDPVLAALSAAGAVLALLRLVPALGQTLDRRPPPSVRTRWDAWIALAFALPYGAAISLLDWSWIRLLLPILPCAAIAGAYGLARGVEVAARRLGQHARAKLAVAAALAALALPSVAWARKIAIAARPDTIEQAAAWLRERADRERDTIAVGFLVKLPMLCDAEALADLPPYFRSAIQRYQARLGDDQATALGWRLRTLFLPRGRREDPTRLKQGDIEDLLARFDARWAVVPVNFDLGLDETALGVRAAGGELAWREVPYQSETAIGDIALWDDLGNDGLLQALTARSAGPGLEIYRLP